MTQRPNREPAPAAPSPGWDASAFDRLPADVRGPVMAGVAVLVGRHALEREAEREMRRPTDVHPHLVDPGRYVDADGKVDRDEIRRDIERVVRDRPELARYGNDLGQESVRPDERRRAAPW